VGGAEESFSGAALAPRASRADSLLLLCEQTRSSTQSFRTAHQHANIFFQQQTQKKRKEKKKTLKRTHAYQAASRRLHFAQQTLILALTVWFRFTFSLSLVVTYTQKTKLKDQRVSPQATLFHFTLSGD
jgi:hypothetical protein